MNHAIFYFFYNLAHQSRVVDDIIVFFAVYFPYIVVFAAGIFLLMHHDIFRAENPFQVFLQKKKEILLCFFSGSLAWVIAIILKIFIHTNRPFIEFANVQSLFLESGFAFPSGHAAFFFALAFIIFFSHKRVGLIFIFFALIISFARVAGGVHFPVDILGGFILAILIAYLTNYFFKK